MSNTNSLTDASLSIIDDLPNGTPKRSRGRPSTKKGTTKPSNSASTRKKNSTPQIITSSSTSPTEEEQTSSVEYENVVFRPNPGPQEEFLAAPEREVLYGGSAGGGKSYAILADPMRYMVHPQFSGLILRHTTEELRELIWKSQELYPKIYPGIKWSERKMQWEAPSGARLWMSYLDRDEDVMRYQGLSFCVEETTPVLLNNGQYVSMKDLRQNDVVATLEGGSVVSFKSEKMRKKCVRVDVYSADGELISSQIQPYTHPIALLSSTPFQSLSDSFQSVDTLLTSPVQWLSFEQVESEKTKTPDSCAYSTNDQSCYTGSEDDNQESQQPVSCFYPVVLHEPCPQLNQDRASTQCCTSYRSSKLLLDSDQCSQESSTDQQQQHEFVQSRTCHNKEQLHNASCDDEDVLLETQKAEDLKCHCSLLCHQCDAQPLCDQECDQCVSQSPDGVEQHSRSDCRCGGKGCIQQCIRYQSSSYVHPYTKEQRPLKAHLKLGFVKFVPLENPFCVVYDITVAHHNHYITMGGIVNKNCYIAFDELTQWASPFAWNYMRSRLRSTAPDLPVFMRATTNPGNRGHQWVKKMFIDPAPAGKSFWATDIETGKTLVYPDGHSRAGQPLFKRRFIPAKLSDNPHLAASGDYEAMLLSLPEMQRKQLLEGSWDIAEGAAFPEFNRQIHVIDPFDIPKDWPRIRACDYGYSSWSAVLWGAVGPDETVYIYRELYVTKMLAEDLAEAVLRLEQNERILYGVLDSSCWHKRGDTGPSIAERMILKGCRWRPADRSAGSRVAGKNEIHRRLQVDPFTEQPRMRIFNDCLHLIADLPTIPLDKNNSEDVDTKFHSDHTIDALRYLLMSRPRSKSIFDFDPAKSSGGLSSSDPVFGY